MTTTLPEPPVLTKKQRARLECQQRRQQARAYYAEAQTPAQFTHLVNRWLDTQHTQKLPQEHHQALREAGVKRCPSCTVVKDLEAFSTLKNGSQNYQCKTCAANRYGDYRKENLEQVRARDRKASSRWKRANPWAVRLGTGYQRAVRMGAPAVRITPEQLLNYWESVGIDPSRSYYTGTPLTPENCSLDHFDPLGRSGTMGHVLENLFPCTVEENTHHKRGLAPHHGLRNIREKVCKPTNQKG